jgi:hypothetical protein
MKITIATPMYGGISKSVYVSCLNELMAKLNAAGHSVSHVSITNESLITRARNTLAHMFLKSDSDALLFIDADHGWVSDDVVKMVNSGKDLIGAIYPMKSINWDNVHAAAISGRPASELSLYSGNFAINFLPENQEFKGDEPFKVRDIGTGMMFIRRIVFDTMAPLCKTYKNNSPSADIPMGETMIEFFPTMITDEPESILLSEDYAFCHLWRQTGNSVYGAPWVRITHAGEYNFGGFFLKTLEIQNQMAVAQSGVNPTETLDADGQHVVNTPSHPVDVTLSQADSLQSLDAIFDGSASESGLDSDPQQSDETKPQKNARKKS